VVDSSTADGRLAGRLNWSVQTRQPDPLRRRRRDLLPLMRPRNPEVSGVRQISAARALALRAMVRSGPGPPNASPRPGCPAASLGSASSPRVPRPAAADAVSSAPAGRPSTAASTNSRCPATTPALPASPLTQVSDQRLQSRSAPPVPRSAHHAHPRMAPLAAAHRSQPTMIPENHAQPPPHHHHTRRQDVTSDHSSQTPNPEA
jgi:hypothetical protein